MQATERTACMLQSVCYTYTLHGIVILNYFTVQECACTVRMASTLQVLSPDTYFDTTEPPHDTITMKHYQRR